MNGFFVCSLQQEGIIVAELDEGVFQTSGGIAWLGEIPSMMVRSCVVREIYLSKSAATGLAPTTRKTKRRRRRVIALLLSMASCKQWDDSSRRPRWTQASVFEVVACMYSM